MRETVLVIAKCVPEALLFQSTADVLSNMLQLQNLVELATGRSLAKLEY